MAKLLVLRGRSLMVWVDLPDETAQNWQGEAAQDLLAGSIPGRLGLPEALARRLSFPRRLRWKIISLGALLMLSPARQSPALAVGRALALSPDQVRLARMVRRGMTEKEAAFRLERSQRWVRCQLAYMRRRGRLPGRRK